MLECRTVISKGGGVVMLAIIRKKLHLSQGEELIIKVDDFGMHLFSLRTAINSVQSLIEEYNPGHKKLTEILVESRAEEKAV